MEKFKSHQVIPMNLDTFWGFVILETTARLLAFEDGETILFRSEEQAEDWLQKYQEEKQEYGNSEND